MHERILVSRHAFVFHSLDKALRLLSIRIRHYVHRSTFFDLFGRQCFFARALLEVRTPAVYNEGANVNALGLELSLTNFLQCVDISSLSFSHIIDAWTVAVLHLFPLDPII